MRILTINPSLRSCHLNEDGKKKDITVEQLKAYYLSGQYDDSTINVESFAQQNFDWDKLDEYYKVMDAYA